MEVNVSRDSLADDENCSNAETRKTRRVATAAFIALTCMLLVSVFYSPSRVETDGQYFTVCGFKVFTGLPCPGCGLTHSFCAIGKGDLGGAFAFNAVGPPLYLFAVMIWLRLLSALAGVKRPVELFDRSVNYLMLVRVFALALGVFGIGRIVYIVIWSPAGLQESPLMRLIQRILA